MNLAKVKFENTAIEVATIDGVSHVALRPIADALQLDWDTQRRNIRQDPVLNPVTVITTATGSDGKQYEMVCLPLDYLNGWLFKINANRYKGQRREQIIRYQRECYRVLARHFLGAAVQTPAPAPAPAPVVPASMDALREAIERAARGETAALRYELHAFATRKGITDPDELLELARAAMDYPGRDKYPIMPSMPPERWQFGSVHPATVQRCIARAINQANK